MLKSFFIATIILLLALTGCSAGPTAEAVEGQQRDEIVAQAQPIIENLFQGVNDNDYAAFSLHFDEAMKKGLDEKAFDGIKTMFDEKIGAFVSLEVDKVENIENFTRITYRARFEKEDGVTVRLTLNQNEPPEVSGLWFDSPKLRTK